MTVSVTALATLPLGSPWYELDGKGGEAKPFASVVHQGCSPGWARPSRPGTRAPTTLFGQPGLRDRPNAMPSWPGGMVVSPIAPTHLASCGPSPHERGTTTPTADRPILARHLGHRSSEHLQTGVQLSNCPTVPQGGEERQGWPRQASRQQRVGYGNRRQPFKS